MIARLLVVSLVFLMILGFLLILPRAIELREQQIKNWSTAAPGPAVPVADLTTSPPPSFLICQTRTLLDANQWQPRQGNEDRKRVGLSVVPGDLQ